MPRRHISALLAAAILAVLAVQASDFWLSKDWKQWSKDDCAKLLVESPWAHVWRGGRAQGINPSGAPQAGQDMNANVQSSGLPNTPNPNYQAGVGYDLVYAVQLRSSLPVREALVRQQQLEQKYDKMNDADRKAFDTRAAQILNRNFDEAILVHVDYSRGGAGPNLAGELRSSAQKRENLHVSLVTEDGSKISASRVDVNQKEAAFDAIFPRTANGVPVITDGQKRFSIQFQSPQLLVVYDTNVAAQPVQVEFDLSKMIVSGKLNY
jgi:hypothetical protein